jgi:hypothetical protein
MSVSFQEWLMLVGSNVLDSSTEILWLSTDIKYLVPEDPKKSWTKLTLNGGIDGSLFHE